MNVNEIVGTRLAPVLSVPRARVTGAAVAPSIADWQERAWDARNWPAVPIIVYQIEDALVLPRGLAFRPNGTIVGPSSDYIEPSVVGEAMRAFDENMQRAVPIDEPALLAIRPGHTCYGHVITEILGSAWAGASILGDRPCSLLISSPTYLAEIYAEVARCAGLGQKPILDNGCEPPLRIKKLYVVEGFAYTDHYLSPLVANFARKILNTCGFDQALARKLYVTREPGTGRGIQNDAEVWSVLKARGFERVRPETLQWREQVRLFAQASHVVGPMGSGIANCLFSPPGAQILTLAPTHMADTFFWRLAGIIGLDYQELRCVALGADALEGTRRGQTRDIVVDVKLLSHWLDQ